MLTIKEGRTAEEPLHYFRKVGGPSGAEFGGRMAVRPYTSYLRRTVLSFPVREVGRVPRDRTRGENRSDFTESISDLVEDAAPRRTREPVLGLE